MPWAYKTFNLQIKWECYVIVQIVFYVIIVISIVNYILGLIDFVNFELCVLELSTCVHISVWSDATCSVVLRID